MRYMLDTNIVSFIAKRCSSILLERIFSYSQSEFCISAITYAELQFGFKHNPQATKVRAITEQFLKHISILEWRIEAANEYADIRSDLTRKGKLIGNMDMLIAAHARAENLILITNNTREFQRVENLKIEDWTIKENQT